MVDDPELNEQEVEHGTLGGDGTISLTRNVNFYLSLLGESLLLLNLHRSFLGDLELLNEFDVLKDSVGVSTDELLEKV